MDKVIRVLEMSTGKDRSLRLLQFLLFTWRIKVGKGKLHEQLSSVISNFSTARQVLRFGGALTLLQYLRNVNSKSGLKGHFSLRTLEALIWLVFFAIDHIAYACKVGLINHEKLFAFVNYWSMQLWLYGDLVGLLGDVSDYYRGVGDKAKLKLSMVKNGTDLVSCIHFVYPQWLGPEVGGVLGAVTSVAGLTQLWWTL